MDDVINFIYVILSLRYAAIELMFKAIEFKLEVDMKLDDLFKNGLRVSFLGKSQSFQHKLTQGQSPLYKAPPHLPCQK